MALKLSMVVLCMVVCMAVVSRHAEGAIQCRTVVNDLLPCKDYLTKGGAVPSSCCNGAKALDKAAKSSADRQTVCKCLKLMAKAYKVSNTKYAAALPSKCKINVGYAISFDTDCNKVH